MSAIFFRLSYSEYKWQAKNTFLCKLSLSFFLDITLPAVSVRRQCCAVSICFMHHCMDRILTFLLHDSTLDNQSVLSRNQQFLFNIEQSIIVLHFISMRFCRMIEFTYQKNKTHSQNRNRTVFRMGFSLRNSLPMILHL